MSASATGVPAFVMPCHLADAGDVAHLRTALAGLAAQTDGRWSLVVVDDVSPFPGARGVLEELAAADPRVHVVHAARNTGPGPCRNAGVAWAAEHDAPFVLFHDADDVSHPMRLEVTRQVLERRPEVDVVYSTFLPVDDEGRAVDPALLTPSVREVLDSHVTGPAHGPDAWIAIGTRCGYVSQTSTVAVRTDLAVAQPFPDVRGSEDSHTWYRMAAARGELAFVPAIGGLYRVSTVGAGSSDRERLGSDAYYRTLVEMNRDGFTAAFELALARGRVRAEDRAPLTAALLRRVAVTVAAEGHRGLAIELEAEALELDEAAHDDATPLPGHAVLR